MIAYPAKFAPEKKAINVTFPDLPEAITCGYSEEEAMEYAVDALETILSDYIKRRRDIPKPGKARGKGMRLVALPTLCRGERCCCMKRCGHRAFVRRTWLGGSAGTNRKWTACSTSRTPPVWTKSKRP